MTNLKPMAIAAAFALTFSGGVNAAPLNKQKTKSNNTNERCTATCPILHSEVAAALEAEFTRLDSDKNGTLDASEQVGISTAQAETSDTIGKIGGMPDSLRQHPPIRDIIMKSRSTLASQYAVSLAFSATLDKNGDGQISRAEWLADGLAQFDAADADHDGAITEAEAKTGGWDFKIVKR